MSTADQRLVRPVVRGAVEIEIAGVDALAKRLVNLGREKSLRATLSGQAGIQCEARGQPNESGRVS